MCVVSRSRRSGRSPQRTAESMSKQGETMTTKFTPGPWFSGSKRVWANETEDRLGMEITLHGGNNKDNNANARLIAAAPDLYAVLSELEESCEYWSEYDVPIGIVERIKSALKRARGE